MRLKDVLERAACWLGVCEVDVPTHSTARMVRHVQADYIAIVAKIERISVEEAAQRVASDWLFQHMEKQHDRVPQDAR